MPSGLVCLSHYRLHQQHEGQALTGGGRGLGPVWEPLQVATCDIKRCDILKVSGWVGACLMTANVGI